MAKIIGNTTATPNPRPDWAQMDETKADYIKNKPELIGQTTEDHGEIFNDYENNQVLSEFAHAEGSNTIAGCKGFLITNIEKVVEDDLSYYASNTDIKITLEGDISKLAAKDIVSIRMFANVGYLRYKADIGAIKEINGNVVTVQVAENRHTDDMFQAPNKDKYPNKPDEDMQSYLWVAKKPDIGDISWFIIQHAEGTGTKALGEGSHAEGRETIANGQYAHAEGRETIADYACHAEGRETKAYGEQSHAEGYRTIVYSGHAEGIKSISYARAGHAEGEETKVKGSRGHAEGFYSEAIGADSHAEGSYTKAEGEGAHAEGGYYYDASAANNIVSTAKGQYSHAEGQGSQAEGRGSHAEGKSKATGEYSHSEGANTVASGNGAHSEGYTDRAFFPENAIGNYSHTEGSNSVAEGVNAHAEGKYAKASGDNSHAEGEENKAIGQASHAEGQKTQAQGIAAHAEGYITRAIGDYSHAQGSRVKANGKYSHAAGVNTYDHDNAIGEASHTEGTDCRAYGKNGYAGGGGTQTGSSSDTTLGENAFAHGKSLSLPQTNAAAFGQYNEYRKIENNKIVSATDPDLIYAIGNGDGSWHYPAWNSNGENRRSNAFAVYKDGHAEVSKQGITDKSIVTKKTLDDKATELASMFNSSVKKTVVSELPASGDENTIYMVGPKVDADGTDYYDEYMFISGKPEIIGNTKTDLSSKMDRFGDYDPTDWILYLHSKEPGSKPPFTIHNSNELTISSGYGLNLDSGSESLKIKSGSHTSIHSSYLTLNNQQVLGVKTPISKEDLNYGNHGHMSASDIPYQAANKEYVDNAIETVNNNISYIEEFIDRVAEATSAEDIIAIAQDIKAKKNQI